MDFQIETYIVYIKINSENYITAINSSEFITNLTDWIKIDEGYGDKYYHAQGNYFPEPIITESGVWRYKFVDNVPLECTPEEIAAQEALIPSDSEQSQNPTLTVYDELEAAYQEGVNSI